MRRSQKIMSMILALLMLLSSLPVWAEGEPIVIVESVETPAPQAENTPAGTAAPKNTPAASESATSAPEPAQSEAAAPRDDAPDAGAFEGTGPAAFAGRRRRGQGVF